MESELHRSVAAGNMIVQTEDGVEVTDLGGPETNSQAPALVDLPLSRRLAAFSFLLLAEFFYGWAWNTVDVLRPFLRSSLGLSLTQAGSAYSFQGAGALIGAITIGQLADRLGRRNMLVVVMVGYGTLLIAGSLVTMYLELLLQRFVLGLFLGGSFPVVVGIYVELFQPNLRGKLASAINTTFSSAIILLGIAFGHLGHHDWRLLLWIGGLPPILLAGFAFVVVPQAVRSKSKPKSDKIPIIEMFVPALRRQTLFLASLTGLNFFAYQAFSGWLTTYLQSVRQLPAPEISHLITAQFIGNIFGGFFWGWMGDRYGRRFGAIGFFVAAVAIVGYLAVPTILLLLIVQGFVYGFALSASVTWGPWLAELYPAHLKSTASSIFNWAGSSASSRRSSPDRLLVTSVSASRCWSAASHSSPLPSSGYNCQKRFLQGKTPYSCRSVLKWNAPSPSVQTYPNSGGILEMFMPRVIAKGRNWPLNTLTLTFLQPSLRATAS